MPKLTDEQRQQIQDHDKHYKDFWDKIENKYRKHQKRHANCRICGESITTTLPNDIFEVLVKHEKTHPEYDEWIKLNSEISVNNVLAAFHDHDCVNVKCACQCGCDTRFCVADLPPEEQNKPMICSMCELYQSRGHIEHRLPQEANK